ncbi:hypothetical protein TNIN_139191 [Trichonephila inaurata madagascariensis]|uniref:Uncharacterized protein n=1 Tax=Trichonephila inaurata madagascariensis TaxID=2747483 RepID=A0A8X6IJ67_9ARAC|nr:hypothetical protein TNIN_139191 [Trichonephila inaurata madagascariensis]
MNNLVSQLNSCRTSDECFIVLKDTEELDSKLREFPFNILEEQSAALRNLSDVLNEACFKFTHQKKQELAEQNNLLQAQIDAWGLPPKPLDAPFQVIVHKKGRKSSNTEAESSAKKQCSDTTTTQNHFSQLPAEEAMDQSAQAGTSTANGNPGVAAPPEKHHLPPITIDNVANQAALLKHLQDITKLKLEAKLIGTKLRIYPQTASAYHLIRKHIDENSLEAYTYMLLRIKNYVWSSEDCPRTCPLLKSLVVSHPRTSL